MLANSADPDEIGIRCLQSKCLPVSIHKKDIAYRFLFTKLCGCKWQQMTLSEDMFGA